MSDPRVNKLPRWARDRIAFLERQLDSAVKELRAELDNAPTDVVHDPYAEDITSGIRVPRFLDPDRSVRFKMGHPRCYIDVRIKEDGDLELMASGSLQLEPQVTNVLRVRLA